MAEVPNILQRSYQACPAKPQLLLQIFPQSVMVGELPKVPIMIHPKPWNTTPIFGSFSFRSFSIIKSARTKNCSTCLNMWFTKQDTSWALDVSPPPPMCMHCVISRCSIGLLHTWYVGPTHPYHGFEFWPTLFVSLLSVLSHVDTAFLIVERDSFFIFYFIFIFINQRLMGSMNRRLINEKSRWWSGWLCCTINSNG